MPPAGRPAHAVVLFDRRITPHAQRSRALAAEGRLNICHVWQTVSFHPFCPNFIQTLVPELLCRSKWTRKIKLRWETLKATSTCLSSSAHMSLSLSPLSLQRVPLKCQAPVEKRLTTRSLSFRGRRRNVICRRYGAYVHVGNKAVRIFLENSRRRVV